MSNFVMSLRCRMLNNRRFAVVVLLISLVVGWSADVYAQEDTEFWFAAPRMLSDHNNKKSATYQIIFFNHNSVDAHVQLSMPANSGSTINKSLTVSAGQELSETLASSANVYPKTDYISVPYDEVSQRGIYIVSDIPIQCYFQVTKGNGEAFTLKGHNALGTEFIVAMQNKFNNGRSDKNAMYEDSYASVSFVASEDGTKVTVTPTQNVTSSCTKSSFSVTLNRGETYAFHSCGEKGSDHPVGTQISSTKPIAVTYNDDCLINGNNADAVGEQLAPTILAGDEYVAVSNRTSSDYIFLVGLSDGTIVLDENGNSYILSNGSVTQISLASRGAIYLKSNNPFEVFQVTGYDGGKGCEMGGTVLPQISCTGSTTASYNCVNATSTSSIKKKDQGVVLNLVTHEDNISALSINGQNISASDFHQLGTSKFYYFSENIYSKFGITDTKIRVVSSKGVFQMGVLDYDKGNTATYGFFSNYASSATVTINDETTNRYSICKGEPLHIKVSPIDKTVKLEDAEVEWRDLLNGGKVRADLKSDVLDIPSVDFDTAAFQVVWKNACGVSSFVNIMIRVLQLETHEETITANDHYFWPINGVTYNASGDYIYEPDCENRYVLHLTIMPTVDHPFSIAKCGITATFARGNLQYNPTANEWRFAPDQLTVIGAANHYISSSYADWIDQFGWATGADPLNTSGDDNEYMSSLNDLLRTSHDWGSNAITNAGNDKWRSLTKDEWDYLLFSRDDYAQLRGFATIDGINGLILLPDDWVKPNGIAFNPNGDYSGNTYTRSQWTLLEQAGAVFLPAAGWRNPTASQAVYQLNNEGYYWTATATSDGRAYEVRFRGDSNRTLMMNSYHRYSGSTVRLVKDLNTIEYVETDQLTASACDSYYWAESKQTYAKSGDYVYETLNAQGCKRIVTLHLTINHSENEEFTQKACDSFYWDENGMEYTESGVYNYVGTTSEGCERKAKLHLTIHKSETDVKTITACDSYTWAENGEVYTESGDYVYESTTANDCDRRATLHLTINKSQHEELTEKACDSFYWTEAGKTYSESGDYEFFTTTAEGCERTVTLHLTINKSRNEEQTETACDSYTWAENGETYTQSGDYLYETTTADGCVRRVLLHLTINKSEDVELNETACDSYFWLEANKEYKQSGDYELETTTEKGCPRHVTLHLTINRSVTDEAYETACGSYYWDLTGRTYTESGDYVHVGTTTKGCTHTSILHLTIPEDIVTDHYDSICPNHGESYFWGGNYYTKPGNYINRVQSKLPPYCDSLAVLHLAYYNQYNVQAAPVVACDSFVWEGTKYTKSGTYTKTLSTIHGCDSIVTLPLTINYTQRISLLEEVCYGSTFTVGSSTYSETGVYVDTLTSYLGCDSIVTLHLTVKPLAEQTVNPMLCPGQSFQVRDPFGGKRATILSTAGTHQVKITAADGCDSILTVNLGFYSNEPVYVSEAICEGESFYRASTGETYSGLAQGEYLFPHQLVTPDGCDYMEYLTLTVYPSYSGIDVFDTICQGDMYEWEGTIYNRTMHDTKVLKTIHGCDSIVTLYLQAWPTYKTTDYRVLCEGEMFSWGETTIQSVKPYDSGDYTYTFQTIHGCDSTVTLTLVVNPIFNISFDATVCDNEVYRWQGDTYTYYNNRDITDTKTLQTIQGCDSVVTMNLHFNPTKQSEFSAVICDNETYTWNGVEYRSSGDYEQTLATSLGCDSVVTLRLTVNPTYELAWADTITGMQTLTWEGTTYSEAGTYTQDLLSHRGCDSIVTLYLTKNEIIVRDIDYGEICVESDSAGTFTFQVDQGYVDYVNLTFSDEAHNQKIKDQRVVIGGTNDAVSVNIPMAARAGIYAMHADYYFRKQIVYSQDIVFRVLYPSSVLLQKWNDFIGVQTEAYNGGYNFTQFEWYKNGMLISGQTGSYIYTPLEIGATYTALLTDETGLQLFTCPLVAVDKDDIGLYPTVVRKSSKINLHVSQTARLTIYDTPGKIHSQSVYPLGDTSFEAPQQAGIYVVRVVLEDNQTEKTYKIIVQ